MIFAGGQQRNMATHPTTDCDIHADERLIFFPTIGHFDSRDRAWHLPIHGWIFKPENDSLRRAAAMGLMRRWLGVDRVGLEAELFVERLRAFLVDNQPHKGIAIRLGGQNYELARSTANGHIIDVLRIAPEVVDAALAQQLVPTIGANGAHERWLHFDVPLAPGDERTIDGSIHLLDDEGSSVISDIDDTIKVTHVHDRKALLRQTFLRDFEAVPGMAELYARWQAAGAAFHYVSRSPWQLYQPLADFLADHNFPAGTFHMRHFRWKSASTLQPDRHGRKKHQVIEAIVTSLPRRQFTFVGDSGEHDPEIYAALARRHPNQVRGIFIRNVKGRSLDGSRFRKAMAGTATELWQVFVDPAELSGVFS